MRQASKEERAKIKADYEAMRLARIVAKPEEVKRVKLVLAVEEEGKLEERIAKVKARFRTKG